MMVNRSGLTSHLNPFALEVAVVVSYKRTEVVGMGMVEEEICIYMEEAKKIYGYIEWRC